jgi:hypothetical protein
MHGAAIVLAAVPNPQFEEQSVLGDTFFGIFKRYL